MSTLNDSATGSGHDNRHDNTGNNGGAGPGAPVPPVMDVRPVGTWVISGVLLVSVLTVWVLVSLIFLNRA